MPIAADLAAANSERSFSRSLDRTRNVYVMNIELSFGVRNGNEDTELLYCMSALDC